MDTYQIHYREVLNSCAASPIGKTLIPEFQDGIQHSAENIHVDVVPTARITDRARAAAKAAVAKATPLAKNRYKVPIFEAIIRRTILRAAGASGEGVST